MNMKSEVKYFLYKTKEKIRTKIVNKQKSYSILFLSFSLFVWLRTSWSFLKKKKNYYLIMTKLDGGF